MWALHSVLNIQNMPWQSSECILGSKYVRILSMQAGPILDTEGVIPGAQFFEKRAFACLHPLNIYHFSTISTENILFKTQDTKLGAIIDLTV